MIYRIGFLPALLILAIAPEGIAQQALAQPLREPQAGYLQPGSLDILSILPSAPVNGDARDQADRDIFRTTRKLEGSKRWAMADDDANASTAELLRHFSCAMDMQLTPQSAPRLVELLQKATRDAGKAIGVAKEFYKRRRPYFVAAGNICRPRDELGQSYDYPSGHALVGWAWAMILAQIDSGHATALLARGRALGDSRVVCGVHNASAVQAGELAASAVVATLSGIAAFREDLDAARSEFQALRATAPKPEPAACSVEATLVSTSYQ